MSIHKLSPGSGYDYLTRQVAAVDATENRAASYYTERGETPGAWIGSGMAAIDGLSAGDAVTAEQMRALFGAGLHPLAAQRLEQLDAADLTEASVRAATRLCAVQGVRQRCQPLPGRGRKADCHATGRCWTAGRSCLCGRSGAGPHRGRGGVLPKAAWPRSDRCPRDRRHHR